MRLNLSSLVAALVPSQVICNQVQLAFAEKLVEVATLLQKQQQLLLQLASCWVLCPLFPPLGLSSSPLL
jgi:hypothetical protein